MLLMLCKLYFYLLLSKSFEPQVHESVVDDIAFGLSFLPFLRCDNNVFVSTSLSQKYFGLSYP